MITILASSFDHITVTVDFYLHLLTSLVDGSRLLIYLQLVGDFLGAQPLHTISWQGWSGAVSLDVVSWPVWGSSEKNEVGILTEDPWWGVYLQCKFMHTSDIIELQLAFLSSSLLNTSSWVPFQNKFTCSSSEMQIFAEITPDAVELAAVLWHTQEGGRGSQWRCECIHI